eukprot:TRINITY_DN4000_c0_g1_i1.p1 TRINITY_DN4000_c0_g1~~TRINITY_DN4000_c0_g1_i1.p1  ORF type:complete len:322 (+),score=32.30 TRINITY_DN4000_c0_g1_i1:75-968(+)
MSDDKPNLVESFLILLDDDEEFHPEEVDEIPSDEENPDVGELDQDKCQKEKAQEGESDDDDDDDEEDDDESDDDDDSDCDGEDDSDSEEGSTYESSEEGSLPKPSLLGSLPNELVTELLSYLPARDICRLGGTCRGFREAYRCELQRSSTLYSAKYGVEWRCDAFSFRQPNALVAWRSIEGLRAIHKRLLDQLQALACHEKFRKSIGCYVPGSKEVFASIDLRESNQELVFVLEPCEVGKPYRASSGRKMKGRPYYFPKQLDRFDIAVGARFLKFPADLEMHRVKYTGGQQNSTKEY